MDIFGGKKAVQEPAPVQIVSYQRFEQDPGSGGIGDNNLKRKGGFRLTNGKYGDRSPAPQTIRPTPKRYLILLLLGLNQCNKSFQWIQIPSATKKIAHYYQVDNFAINALSSIFLLSFIFGLPACLMIEKLGLRRTILFASFGTVVGSALKCFSCQQGQVGLLFVAQILVAIAEQLIYSIPTRLASVWFPDHQVSTAQSFVIQCAELGHALGFVVPQLMLSGSETQDEIGYQLRLMFYGTAAFSVALYVACLVFVEDAPKHAPGQARLKQIEVEKQRDAGGRASAWSATQALGRQALSLLSDKHILLVNLSYGLSVGTDSAIYTVLNQIMAPLYPGDDMLIGSTGLCMIVFGCVGSVFVGHALDKSHKYKLATILSTIASMLSLLVFAYAVSYAKSAMLIHLGAALLGIAQISVMVCGMELSVELTYPAPELVPASLMNISHELIGTALIFVASFVVDTYGASAVNGFFFACYLLSLVLLLCMKENLRRQQAAKLNERLTSMGSSELEKPRTNVSADEIMNHTGNSSVNPTCVRAR